MSITYKNRRKLDILKLKYNALYVALGQDIYLMTVFKLKAEVSDCHAYWSWKWDMPGISVKCQCNKGKTYENNPIRSEKKYMSLILINMMATKKKYAFTRKF